MRELAPAPAARGSQVAGFTKPRVHSFARPCIIKMVFAFFSSGKTQHSCQQHCGPLKVTALGAPHVYRVVHIKCELAYIHRVKWGSPNWTRVKYVEVAWLKLTLRHQESVNLKHYGMTPLSGVDLRRYFRRPDPKNTLVVLITQKANFNTLLE